MVLAWYKVVLGYYRAFMPVYIEKVEIWSDVIVVGRTTLNKERWSYSADGAWTAEMSKNI